MQLIQLIQVIHFGTENQEERLKNPIFICNYCARTNCWNCWIIKLKVTKKCVTFTLPYLTNMAPHKYVGMWLFCIFHKNDWITWSCRLSDRYIATAHWQKEQKGTIWSEDCVRDAFLLQFPGFPGVTSAMVGRGWEVCGGQWVKTAAISDDLMQCGGSASVLYGLKCGGWGQNWGLSPGIWRQASCRECI